ncbi:hypothetical protein HK104_008150, partial [Borealophlyctis nickersoniae]
YVVNTRIENPHEGLVTSLRFSPGGSDGEQLLAVTTGKEGRFKIWQLNEPADDESAEPYWSLRSISYYKSLPCHDSSFSSDGSVLAVATGHVVTLWDPYTCELRAALSYHPPDMPVKRVQFVHGSPFLVSCTAEHLIVWSLLTCTGE